MMNLEYKLRRLHQPLCTRPRLLSLAVGAVDTADNVGYQIWPRFTSDFKGPYYVSTGTLSNFTIYARSNFKAIEISFSADENIFNIASGNVSSPINFNANEFSKNIMVDIKAMGWSSGLWVAKSTFRYEMVISRFDPLKTNVGVQFKNPISPLAIQKSSHDAAVIVSAPVLNTNLNVAKVGTGITKYFQTTREALNNGEPIPALNNVLYWKEADGSSVSLRSCDDSVFLVQVNNRLLMSYQINATMDAQESVLIGTNAGFSKVGTVAKIVLNKNLVKKFCSPGSALQRAFAVDNTAGLLTGATTLDIQLHANAGPFYLKDTLEVISRSPVLQQVQNVVYLNGELTLTFPGPHRQSTGDIVTVSIPGKRKSKDEEVAVTVIDSKQLKVKYTKPEHTGQFAGYEFSPQTKVICYTAIRKVTNIQMWPFGSDLGDPLTDFTIKVDGILEQHDSMMGMMGTAVGKGKVKVGNAGGTSTCIEATMSEPKKPMVNSDVIIDKGQMPIVCYNAPCTYVCHGGSETLDLNLGETQRSIYTTNEFGPVSFPTDATATLSGSKLTVELPTHSCGRNGVKIGEILQNGQGENNLVPRCDPSQAGENCAW